MQLKLDEFNAATDDGHVDLADFHSLLAPLSKEVFYADYWQRKPLLVRGRVDVSIQRALSLEHIDRLVGAAVLRTTDLRASRDHQSADDARLFPEGVADKQAALDLFFEGYSLIFDQVDRHLPALGAMMCAWESALGQTVRANAFLTPRKSRGFNRHYDTHDVVVIQVHGSKIWDVCDAPLPLPHEEQQRLSSRHGAAAGLIRQVELHPGDLLYLPRGFVHGAQANDGDTLHLSVSIRNRALRDVLAAALRREVMADLALKSGVRFGSIDLEAVRSDLIAAAQRIDLAAAMDEWGEGFNSHRQRADNRLLELELSKQIDAETQFSFVPHALFHISTTDDGSTDLIANGERLVFDAQARGLDKLLASRRDFSASEFIGDRGEHGMAQLRMFYLSGLLSVRNGDVRL